MDRSYWRRVGQVLVWQVAASMCYYAVYAATPFFRDKFGLSRLYVGIVITVVALGYAVFLLPIGAMTDRYGERVTLIFGLGGLSLATVLVPVAPTYLALLFAGFVLGSLYGTAMPGTNKAIYDNVSPRRVNLAIGIKQIGVTVGSGTSTVLVTGVLFWEFGFWIAALVAVAVTALFIVSYRTTATRGRATYPDFRGLASNRPYRALVLAGLFLGGAIFTTIGYTVLFIEESVGASVAVGGLVLALMQLSGSVGRVVMGWLSDVLPGEPRVRIGFILFGQSVASTVLLVTASLTATPLVAALVFVVLGFFVLGLTGIYYSCMATLVSSEEIGGATAGGQLALTTGGLLAPPAFGYLADTLTYRASWWLLAGGCLVASVLILDIVRTETPVEEPAMTT